MLRSRTAASAHQAESEFADKLFQGVGQLDRLQRVERTVGRQLWQPGIRHAAHADLRMPGQVPEVFAHFRRTRCAIETDQVDAEARGR